MKADSPEVSYVYEASNYGGSHDPNVFCVHSVECPIEDGFARSLIGPNWFGGPAPTSAHYLIGPDDTCQGVPENRIAWHCGNGNKGSIAGEQCGYAHYDLAKWNSPKGRAQRTRFARLLADVNKRRPLIQFRKLSLSELRYALTHPGTPGGVCTHDQMRQAMGGTTHYDPMNSPGASVAYPLSDLINEAIQIRGGKPPIDTPIEDDDMYRLYKPNAGPDVNAYWCAMPGLYEPIGTAEQANVLVSLGMAHPVKEISQREHDVMRDFCRRYSSWQGVRIDSMVVPGSRPTASEMLAFTNKAAEAAAAPPKA